MKLMSPEQNLSKSIILHTILYGYKNKEDARFAICDHIFNVIGNGLNNIDYFIQEFDIDNYPDRIVNYDLTQFFNSPENLVCTYAELDPQYESMGMKVGLRESFIDIMTEEEAQECADVAAYSNTKSESSPAPYPNFSKQYSLIYNNEILELLDVEWLNEAKWFYQKCKEFFQSDRVYEFHGYFPREEDTNEWEKLISRYEKRFENMKDTNDTTESFHKKISDAYELPYNGDTKQFIKERGYNEVNKALAFIDETIEKIDSEIHKRNN